MPDARAQQAELLARVIEDGIGEALALEQALHAERRALETRDHAALALAAEEKHSRVARLEELETKRKASSRALYPAQERPGPSADIPAAGEAAGSRWQNLLSIVARCKRLNATNGAIIHLRARQVDDALGVVSGTVTGTYSPSGARSSSGSRRTLAAI